MLTDTVLASFICHVCMAYVEEAVMQTDVQSLVAKLGK